MMLGLIRRVRKFLRPVKKYTWEMWCDCVAVPFARFYIGRVKPKERGHKKIRVLFLVNEIAKWKMQTVLDAMLASSDFEPIVAVTIADLDWRRPIDQVKLGHDNVVEYFQKRGVNVVQLCDVEKRRVFSPKRLNPDVVFYQQPWDYGLAQHPALVSRYAMTCYVQYFVPNYGNVVMDCMSLFTRTVNRFYVMSESWRHFYEESMQKVVHACTYVTTGHPALDYYRVDEENHGATKMIIYAPHWSISYPGFMNTEHYSTFLENGERILGYAKSHPEIKWVFKPHPNLKYALRQSGAWSEDKITQYYDEWGKIGRACYTCDYPALFKESCAMVTDCGSFLSEYPSTGKPLIRLVSSKGRYAITSVSGPYLDSLYNVHSWEELMRILDEVVLRGNDYKKAERLRAAEVFGILHSCATENILNDIRGCL